MSSQRSSAFHDCLWLFWPWWRTVARWKCLGSSLWRTLSKSLWEVQGKGKRDWWWSMYDDIRVILGWYIMMLGWCMMAGSPPPWGVQKWSWCSPRASDSLTREHGLRALAREGNSWGRLLIPGVLRIDICDWTRDRSGYGSKQFLDLCNFLLDYHHAGCTRRAWHRSFMVLVPCQRQRKKLIRLQAMMIKSTLALKDIAWHRNGQSCKN